MKYDEKQPEESEPETEEAIPEAIEGKVKAYAVRVDGQVIGAVEDYSSIEEALNEIKQPYDSGEYSEINFDKDIEYDLEEYVDPVELVDPEDVISTLTGRVVTARSFPESLLHTETIPLSGKRPLIRLLLSSLFPR